MAGLALAGAHAALRGWDALALRGVGGRTPSHPQVLVLTRRGRHRVVGGVRLRPTHRPYAVRYTAAIDPVLPLVPVVSAARAVCDAATGVRP
jgi:hypothetical protein